MTDKSVCLPVKENGLTIEPSDRLLGAMTVQCGLRERSFRPSLLA